MVRSKMFERSAWWSESRCPEPGVLMISTARPWSRKKPSSRATSSGRSWTAFIMDALTDFMASSPRAVLKHFQQRLRIARRSRFMHEIDVDPLPRGCRQPLRPVGEVRVGVVLQPQARVAPRRGLDEGRRGVVLALGEAEGRAGRLERRVDVLGGPCGIAEFEGGAVIGGQDREELLQPRQILLQERRQLEQHRPALGAERLQVAVEKGDGGRGGVGLEPGKGGDAARGLDGEAEGRLRGTGPVLEYRPIGHVA